MALTVGCGFPAASSASQWDPTCTPMPVGSSRSQPRSARAFRKGLDRQAVPGSSPVQFTTQSKGLTAGSPERVSFISTRIPPPGAEGWTASSVAAAKRTRPPLSAPVRDSGSATMLIDAATRANLELTRTLGGERQGSLLAAVDRTVTPGGARLLAEWLAGPLTDPAAIATRHDAVELLVLRGLLARLAGEIKSGEIW